MFDGFKYYEINWGGGRKWRILAEEGVTVLSRGGQGRPRWKGETGAKAGGRLEEVRELAMETSEGGIFQVESRTVGKALRWKERKKER